MLGFTKQEQGIILFLILSLLIGLGVKTYYRFFENVSITEVDREDIEEFEQRAEIISSDVAATGPVNSQKSEKNSFGSDNLESNHSQANDNQFIKTNSEIKEIKNDAQHVFININTAGSDELQKIPHIGSVLAGRIIAYRENHKKFESIEELTKIKGIGEATLRKIAPYVTLQ